MKRVILNYDESSGVISDKLGTEVGNWFDLQSFGEPSGEPNVRDLIKLKEAGFTAEDIVALKEGGVL